MIKLLIDVIIPANGKTYEFQLDGAMPVGIAKVYIAEHITKMEHGAVVFSEDLILGDVTTEKRLDDNTSLYKSGVRSGHTIALA